jgi:hypothetical protein
VQTYLSDPNFFEVVLSFQKALNSNAQVVLFLVAEVVLIL